jgi:hypothetical protein
MADLRTLQRVLSELIERCDSGEAPNCPLIEALLRQSSRMEIE